MIPLLAVLAAVPFSAPQESWLERLNDNLRWTIDESARVVVDRKGDAATLAFFGLDIHKVISTERGDFATLTLQPYLTRVDDLTNFAPLYDGPDDWELVWRIFNANVKLLRRGALNLRVGHFELPFGLEHTINTNGTLRDYTHGANFGFKADWGVGLNGVLPALEYEVALSRGSGNEYRDDGDPWVASGRVGTPADSDQSFGISFLDGELREAGVKTRHERIGLDAMVYRRDLGFYGEVSSGKIGANDVHRALGEVNWRNMDETLLAWWQLVLSDSDGAGAPGDTLDSMLGLRWKPSAGWTVSLQYKQNLEPASAAEHRAGALELQLRYRF